MLPLFIVACGPDYHADHGESVQGLSLNHRDFSNLGQRHGVSEEEANINQGAEEARQQNASSGGRNQHAGGRLGEPAEPGAGAPAPERQHNIDYAQGEGGDPDCEDNELVDCAELPSRGDADPDEEITDFYDCDSNPWLRCVDGTPFFGDDRPSGEEDEEVARLREMICSSEPIPSANGGSTRPNHVANTSICQDPLEDIRQPLGTAFGGDPSCTDVANLSVAACCLTNPSLCPLCRKAPDLPESLCKVFVAALDWRTEPPGCVERCADGTCGSPAFCAGRDLGLGNN